MRHASGSLIAHFDDDDYYAPSYLETMVQSLGSADLIKLSKWLAWRESDGSLWLWDTTFIAPSHFIVAGSDRNTFSFDLSPHLPDKNAFNQANTWGYGFSYVYKKSLWETCKFDNTSAGEDYRFILKAQEQNKVLIHRPDLACMVLHVLHTSSTSQIFPQLHLTPSQGIQLLGNEAANWLITDQR